MSGVIVVVMPICRAIGMPMIRSLVVVAGLRRALTVSVVRSMVLRAARLVSARASVVGRGSGSIPAGVDSVRHVGSLISRRSMRGSLDSAHDLATHRLPISSVVASARTERLPARSSRR
jgi:hypothetical protein